MLKVTSQSNSRSSYIYIYIYIYSALTLLLVLLPALVISFNLSNSAFADDITAKINVAPSLKITIPTNTLTIALDPSNNDFDSEDITVSVATNHRKGYKLYLDADTTNLVNTNDSTKYIETLSSSAPQTNFTVNKWGYRISAGDPTAGNTGDSTIYSTTNYFPFVSHKLISSSEGATNGTSATLDFASRVDYTKPAGIYSIETNFLAIPVITSYYMQDFKDNSELAQEVCVRANPTIVLDKRDEQAYMIQRLADNKCWMLDNLNLDLTDRNVVDALTTSNTNINTTTDPYALESLKNGARGQGAKYATAGLEYHNWTGVGMTPESLDISYAQPLVNRSGKCDPNKNTAASSNYPCVGDYQNHNYMSGTVIDKADAAKTKYDYGPGGYKIGTYYNYCAASAGSYCYDSSSGTGDATSDICPAGWHMPSDIGGNNGDYLTLCSVIKGGDGCTGDTWNDMDAKLVASMQYQLSTPLSGLYHSGTAYRQGDFGYFWSSSRQSASNMYSLLVRSPGLHPQDHPTRRNGFSVRCVAS